MFCSHDCERCPYDDCICPEDEFSALEWAESEKRERETDRGNCEADYDDEEQAASVRRRQMKREWYLAHRGSELIKRAVFREANRERLRQENMAYYEAHKEEINAKRREKRAIERARKLAERQPRKKQQEVSNGDKTTKSDRAKTPAKPGRK